MSWQISTVLLRRLEIIMASLASANMFLIVASIGFGMGSQTWINSKLLLFPQVIVNLYALFYTYFKYLIIHKWLYQLILSHLLAGAYIYFAATIFPLTTDDSGQFLISAIEGSGVIVSILLCVNSIFTVIIVRREKIDRPLDYDRETDETGPPQIHIYQPRIDLTVPSSDQPSGDQPSVTAQSTASSSNQAHHQRNHLLERGDGSQESLELEILPKYQRSAPTQRVTIIDLSNLENVDPAVLNNVLGGESAQSQHSRQNSSTIAAVEVAAAATAAATSTSTTITTEVETDAPAYSPPLIRSDEDLSTLTPPSVSTSTSEDETRSEIGLSTIVTISSSEVEPTSTGETESSISGPSDPPVYMP